MIPSFPCGLLERRYDTAFPMWLLPAVRARGIGRSAARRAFTRKAPLPCELEVL